MRDLGVVYLYRHAEGESPVRRFLQSYYAHPAGTDHDLIVAFKGFMDRYALAQARALFGTIPISSVELDDVGYDIGSYVQTAKLTSNRRLLFLNTFSHILADNWLTHFSQAVSTPGVSLVGATGSWLSNTSIFEGRIKYHLGRVCGRREVFPQPLQSDEGGDESGDSKSQRPHLVWLRAGLWDYPRAVFNYPRYPNPHVRTNAFMMERELFLSLCFPRFATKGEAHKFESGRHSMTRQILRRHMLPVIVDRHGQSYDICRWRLSSTFFANGQSNLIIGDNQTLKYDQADSALRKRMEYLAWVRPRDWDTAMQRPLR